MVSWPNYPYPAFGIWFGLDPCPLSLAWSHPSGSTLFPKHFVASNKTNPSLEKHNTNMDIVVLPNMCWEKLGSKDKTDTSDVSTEGQVHSLHKTYFEDELQGSQVRELYAARVHGETHLSTTLRSPSLLCACDPIVVIQSAISSRSITQLFSRPMISKSHCMISQEPFFHRVWPVIICVFRHHSADTHKIGADLLFPLFAIFSSQELPTRLWVPGSVSLWQGQGSLNKGESGWSLGSQIPLKSQHGSVELDQRPKLNSDSGIPDRLPSLTKSNVSETPIWFKNLNSGRSDENQCKAPVTPCKVLSCQPFKLSVSLFVWVFHFVSERHAAIVNKICSAQVYFWGSGRSDPILTLIPVRSYAK